MVGWARTNDLTGRSAGQRSGARELGHFKVRAAQSIAVDGGRNGVEVSYRDRLRGTDRIDRSGWQGDCGRSEEEWQKWTGGDGDPYKALTIPGVEEQQVPVAWRDTLARGPVYDYHLTRLAGRDRLVLALVGDGVGIAELTGRDRGSQPQGGSADIGDNDGLWFTRGSHLLGCWEAQACRGGRNQGRSHPTACTGKVS